MKTKEDILYDLGLGLDPKTDSFILDAMEEYAQEVVKNLNIPAVSKSLDLRELERKLDEALGKETRETLTEWLKQQRQ